MGTNYYFIIKNSQFAHEHFATKSNYSNYYYDGEYEIGENPDLHFSVHLNKCSCGWRPLFQIHREWDTFKKLEEFYQKYKKYLRIQDEYGDKYTWNQYKKIVTTHGVDDHPTPLKWTYDITDYDREYTSDPQPRLHLIDCNPDEAEIFEPFNHLEYAETEIKAAKKFGVWNQWREHNDFYSHNDPDYCIDWAKGEFS